LGKFEKVQEVAPLIASKPEDIEDARKSIQKRGLGNAKKLPAIAIHFDTGSAVFNDNEKKMLDKMVEIMKRDFLSYSFKVQGHNDSEDPEKSNKDLSDKRAKSVANYLFERGIEPTIIEIEGFGEDSPIASNLTNEGKSINRRVQF
jgi:outer membrane protein OmpA-like peptidoglycan-associated protein